MAKPFTQADMKQMRRNSSLRLLDFHGISEERYVESFFEKLTPFFGDGEWYNLKDADEFMRQLYEEWAENHHRTCYGMHFDDLTHKAYHIDQLMTPGIEFRGESMAIEFRLTGEYIVGFDKHARESILRQHTTDGSLLFT